MNNITAVATLSINRIILKACMQVILYFNGYSHGSYILQSERVCFYLFVPYVYVSCPADVLEHSGAGILQPEVA